MLKNVFYFLELHPLTDMTVALNNTNKMAHISFDVKVSSQDLTNLYSVVLNVTLPDSTIDTFDLDYPDSEEIDVNLTSFILDIHVFNLFLVFNETQNCSISRSIIRGKIYIC